MTLVRRLRILQMLPREGEGSITAPQVRDWLERDYGIEADRRTVERDLAALAAMDDGHFPVAVDDDSKPFQWSWYGSESIGIPKMGRHTALSFHLVQEYLAGLLPGESLRHLQPNFDAADEALSRGSEQRTRRWMDKVRVVPLFLRRLPAPIAEGILDGISQALYDEKQVEISYRAGSSKSGEAKTYAVHPYGLLHRDMTIELIGRIDGNMTVRRWVLHRMQAARMLEVTATIPATFNIDRFVEEKLAYPLSGREISFKARFSSYAVRHVVETPLSADQSIEQVEDDVIVTATLRETIELKWWLLGLGHRVVVYEPETLRDEIRGTIEKMMDNYPS